jgi:RNA polymerase sigma factor (sigma-70 family)
MNGNRVRFEALVLPHLDAAYRFAISLSRSPADAEDLVQDAILRAYRSIETLRAADAKAWLLTIVRNCFFTARARNGRRETVPLPDQGESETPDALIEPSPGPESASMQQARQEAVGRSMSKLSTEHRQVLTLREIEEMSYSEIASVTQLPIGTVMSRLARARTAFREQWLADHGETST